jgi:hypothetical protein
LLAGSPEDETDEAAAAMGLAGLTGRPEEDEPDQGIWPENLWPVRLFEAMMTQWRVGPGGPIGLDYGVREAQANVIGLPRKGRAEVYEALRDMEYAALDYFAKQRKT